MNKINPIHCIIVLLLGVLLSQHAAAQCNADSLIYKLVLQAHNKGRININEKECKYLTIDYRPAEPDIWGFIHSKIDVDSVTYKNLLNISYTLSVAYHTSHLNRIYQGDYEVKILNKEDYKKFTAKNFWKKFWKTYPESAGQTFVSAIGYNENSTEAIFYFEIVSQWLVGEGCFAVCRFENGVWVVKDIIGVLQM